MNSNEIRTSINVDLKYLEIIENHAEKYGMSVSDVMNIILDMHIKKMSKKPRHINRAMKYQERSKTGEIEYKSTHIRLSFITYSRLRDVMILFRYTLSYLLSLAMEFFDEYIGNKTVKFFPPSIHSVIVEFEDDLKMFSNFWCLPPLEFIPGG
ncbi:MAG TPA: hypothetical protein P5123_05970 [Spirochaetota bacterium]|nr:hypothetical protein [Spirochaetota bacterium]